MDLNDYVVRGSSGSIDSGATVAKFEAELAAFVTGTAEEQGNISGAVSAVFDENKGKRIAMPTLISLSLVKLNAQVENFQALGEKVHTFVKANTETYSVAKGKGGGVGRIADLPVKA
jgi:hypothetical protein